jgi:Zn-finger protein
MKSARSEFSTMNQICKYFPAHLAVSPLTWSCCDLYVYIAP